MTYLSFGCMTICILNILMFSFLFAFSGKILSIFYLCSRQFLSLPLLLGHYAVIVYDLSIDFNVTEKIHLRLLL